MRKLLPNTLRIAFLSLLTIVTIYPFLLMLSVSFMSQQDFVNNPLTIPPTLMTSNYALVWERGGIARAFLNSLLITTVSVAIQVFLGSLVGYALSKMNFRRAHLFSVLFLIPMILPPQVIPLYLIFRSLGLINSYFGLFIYYAAIGLPLVIFIFTSFLRTIPIQISECAFTEGASHLQIYLKIMLPLQKPVIATVVVISGLSIWNDFFAPLILITSRNMRTIPLTIFQFFGQYSARWPVICACLVLMVIPILLAYIILQRHIISGVVAGSIKG